MGWKKIPLRKEAELKGETLHPGKLLTFILSSFTYFPVF